MGQNNPETKKEKSPLAKAFSLAGTLTNITLEATGSWIFPPAKKRDPNAIRKNGKRKRSYRGLFAAAAFTVFGQPYLGTKFQSAEDFLAENNLDPKIATMLSDDTQIRVRHRNLAGILHSATDLPTLIGLFNTVPTLLDRGNAYMTKGFLNLDEILFNTGMVTLPDPDITAKERISIFTGIPEELIENIPITDEEFYYYIVFHEFRHADDDNTSKHTPLIEGDADNFAIDAAIKVFNNPNIEDVVIACRAMHELASTHNSGLYLQTARNEDKEAHWAFIQGSTVTVFGLAQDYISDQDPRADFIKMTEALQHVLHDYKDDLSPWDVKRAELYINSAAYFAPTSIAGIGHSAHTPPNIQRHTAP